MTTPLDPLTGRWIDGGPVYTETDTTRWIVEPWNAASAFVFVLLVLAWVMRLRGRYRLHPFLTCCLPVLAAGGLGGTLYHAFRSSVVFFLMDVIPIMLLGVGVSVYLWVRLVPRLWHVAIVLVLYVVLQLLFRGLMPSLAITASYAALGTLILLPVLVVLARTGFRHAGWVGLALASFGVALFFRYADVLRPPLLPMGTHWLWHLFGAGATAALSEYLYRVEPLPLRRPAESG